MRVYDIIGWRVCGGCIFYGEMDCAMKDTFRWMGLWISKMIEGDGVPILDLCDVVRQSLGRWLPEAGCDVSSLDIFFARGVLVYLQYRTRETPRVLACHLPADPMSGGRPALWLALSRESQES